MVVFIIYYFEEVEEFCDCIVIINNGCLIVNEFICELVGKV